MHTQYRAHAIPFVTYLFKLTSLAHSNISSTVTARVIYNSGYNKHERIIFNNNSFLKCLWRINLLSVEGDHTFNREVGGLLVCNVRTNSMEETLQDYGLEPDLKKNRKHECYCSLRKEWVCFYMHGEWPWFGPKKKSNTECRVKLITCMCRKFWIKPLFFRK